MRGREKKKGRYYAFVALENIGVSKAAWAPAALAKLSTATPLQGGDREREKRAASLGKRGVKRWWSTHAE